MAVNLAYLTSGILLLGVIILVFYNYFYKPGRRDRELLLQGVHEMHDNFEQTTQISTIIKDRSEIILPGHGNGLTFNWQMYLEDPQSDRIWSTSYAKDKSILRIGDSPQITYNPKYNILKLTLKYRETPFYAHYPIIELKNIPLRRWNSYIVVINGTQIHIYLNGKLVISKILPSDPIIASDDIILGHKNNNIQGKLSEFTVFFRPYNTQDIKLIL